MKSEPYSQYFDETPAALQAARLIERFGFTSNTDYGIDSDGSSSTTRANTRAALVDFGYSCSNLTDYTPYLVRESLDDSRPVLMFGNDINDPDRSGHAWVVDGYEYTYNIIKYYHSNPPYNLYKSVQDDISLYFRCNPGDITIVNVLAPNFNFGDGNGDGIDEIFNDNKQIIYNIRPNN